MSKEAEKNYDAMQSGGMIIGKNVLLGERVAILPGVTIGDNCIIEANSVVTKNIPPFSIAAGNPARIIKKLAYEGLSISQ